MRTNVGEHQGVVLTDSMASQLSRLSITVQPKTHGRGELLHALGDRIGHRGSVLIVVGIWHAIVALTLIGERLHGQEYEAITFGGLIGPGFWMTSFALSSVVALIAAFIRSNRYDRWGFVATATVTSFWGFCLLGPALSPDVFGGLHSGGIRTAGAWIVIGLLLGVTSLWPDMQVRVKHE